MARRGSQEAFESIALRRGRNRDRNWRKSMKREINDSVLEQLAKEETQMPENGLRERIWEEVKEEKAKETFWKPRFVVTSGLVLTGIAVGAFLLKPGTPLGPSLSMAEVLEQAMREVNTVTWTETIETQSKHDGDMIRSKTSIRMRPFQYAREWEHCEIIAIKGKKLPTVVRSTKSVSTPDGLLESPSLNWANEKVYSIGDIPWENTKNMMSPQKWAKFFFQDMTSYTNISKETLSQKNYPPEITFLNGKKTILYQFDSISQSYDEKTNLKNNSKIWVEANTKHFIKIVLEGMSIDRNTGLPFLDTNGKHRDNYFYMMRTCENYEYNTFLSKNVFSVARPTANEPFTVVDNRKKYDFSKKSPKESIYLSPSVSPKSDVGKKINMSIDQIIKSWNRKDTQFFLNSWDWEYQERNKQHFRKSRRESLDYVKLEKDKWTKKVNYEIPYISSITKVNSRINDIAMKSVLQSEKELFPPNSLPVMYDVWVQAKLKNNKTGKKMIFLHLTMHQINNEMKIVSMGEPWLKQ
jgi:hypothetical protein